MTKRLHRKTTKGTLKDRINDITKEFVQKYNREPTTLEQANIKTIASSSVALDRFQTKIENNEPVDMDKFVRTQSSFRRQQELVFGKERPWTNRVNEPDYPIDVDYQWFGAGFFRRDKEGNGQYVGDDAEVERIKNLIMNESYVNSEGDRCFQDNGYEYTWEAILWNTESMGGPPPFEY